MMNTLRQENKRLTVHIINNNSDTLRSKMDGQILTADLHVRNIPHV